MKKPSKNDKITKFPEYLEYQGIFWENIFCKVYTVYIKVYIIIIKATLSAYHCFLFHENILYS